LNSGVNKPNINGTPRNAQRTSDGVDALTGKITKNTVIRDGKFDSRLGDILFSDYGISSGFISEKALSLEELRKAIRVSMPTMSGDLTAITGNIIFDCVIEISRKTFIGQVYNLQTSAGWYISEGIITHNCAILPWVKGADNPITQTGEDWFKSQPESVQRDAMGNGKWEAWNNGKFEFGALSREYENDVFGLMRGETPLKDLIGGSNED